MKASTKNKADRMLAVEERKLERLVPELLAVLGFMRNPKEEAQWAHDSERFIVPAYTANYSFTVTPYVGSMNSNDTDGWPWLACRFSRPQPRPDLPWSAPENHAIFTELRNVLGDVNQHSGKWNAHIHVRCTAIEALEEFGIHLVRAIVKPAETRVSMDQVRELCSKGKP